MIVLALLLALVQAAHDHPAPPASADVLAIAVRPLPIRSGIGSAHDSVATASKEAQAFYDQGLAYLHSYVWLEAARSFNQALRLDPNLAMAHAQLAIAYTELNAPAAAREALARAQTLAPKANDHDRTHIDARVRQVAAESDPSTLSAYRSALDAALAKFPQDEELWLARGQAESPDPAERGQGSTAGSIRFYEKALALAPTHFAAHHYLTHAYENSGRVDDALKEGAAYAAMSPSVPHARHMHGHDLRRAGKVDAAIEEFRAADALATSYFKAEDVAPGLDWHYQHNLDLLAATYQYAGEMKAAAAPEGIVRDRFAARRQEFNKRAWTVFPRARTRRRERWRRSRDGGHIARRSSARRATSTGRALLLQEQVSGGDREANAALRRMRSCAQRRGPRGDAR